GRRQRAGGRAGEARGESTAGLYANKRVQKELKLTAEQVKDLPPAIRKAREKHQAYLAQLRDLEPDKQIAIMKKVADETIKAIADILKPEQVKRLKQIDRQQWVISYVISAEVAKDLKLTDDQKDKIRDIYKEYTEQVTRLAVGSARPFDQESHEKLTKASLAAFVEVLTDDQRKAWHELIGEPFELKADPVPFLVGSARRFSDQRVQKELKLTAEQLKSIQDGLAKVQEKYREEISKVGGGGPGAQGAPGGTGGGLDPEQFAALKQNVGEENQKVIAGALKPEQAKRLKQ